MQKYPECYPCFLKQALDALKLSNASEEDQMKVMMEASKIMSEDQEGSPPLLATKIHRYLKKVLKDDDPFYDIKRESNKRAKALVPKMRSIIENSKDPFSTTVKISAAGNSIDYGARSSTELTRWEDEILEIIKHDHPHKDEIKKMKDNISRADHVLFLADNAGEIVFDKLLLEQIGNTKITVVVRGKPIINDVLLEDAKEANVDELANIINNGSDVPGTWIPYTSKEFQDVFDNSELIISKGQGNFETLIPNEKNIYFLFRVKCGCVARLSKRNEGELVLLNSLRM